MLVEGPYSLVRLLRRTIQTVVFLTLIAFASLGLYRWLSPEPAPLLYSKIGYVLSAISIFIAFRVNQAYDRWWEARKLWGSLINESRSWGRITVARFSPQAPIARELVMRQIAYVHTLRIALRYGTGELGCSKMKAQLQRLLSKPDEVIVDESHNVPTQLLSSQAAALERALSADAADRLVWSQLTGALSAINVAQGGCERIKKTVFPATITQFTRFMVWSMAPLMIFAILGDSDGHDALELPVVVFVATIFVVIEQIARDLQTPFENDADTTPMSAICTTIETELRQMLHDPNLPEPQAPMRGVLK